MHCKKASVVINPRTGQNVAKITDVLAVLAAAGWETDIAIKEYGGHTMELAQEAASDNSDLVIAYGGDGTLNQVLNGVMNAKKGRSVIGVIPGGTANLWAGDVGVPSDPVQAALSLINSEEHKVDIGYVAVQDITFPDGQRITVNGKKKKLASKARHHFLLMAGLGMDAAVMEGVSKPLKYRIGPLAVGLSAARELPAQRPFPIEVWSPDEHGDEGALWSGEAVQVIVGNTRRYAIVLEMTPDAYVDDGVLDVCVITRGNPLTTMQQISSLLLRQKPDNITTEYFRGPHLGIRVPASVPLELDGSTIKLKDYLSRSDYEAVQQAGDLDQVKVTYRFDSLPKALDFAIPRTYSGDLFEGSSGQEKAREHEDLQAITARSSTEGRHAKEGEHPQTPLQEHTAIHETRSPHNEREEEIRHNKPGDENPNNGDQKVSSLVSALLENGRKVLVVGKVPNPEKKQSYIIAGHSPKPSSRAGDTLPVAVVVNGKTIIFNREGENVSLEAVEQLHEGDVIVVEGSKSKRGVITATRVVL